MEPKLVNGLPLKRRTNRHRYQPLAKYPPTAPSAARLVLPFQWVVGELAAMLGARGMCAVFPQVDAAIPIGDQEILQFNIHNRNKYRVISISSYLHAIRYHKTIIQLLQAVIRPFSKLNIPTNRT